MVSLLHIFLKASIEATDIWLTWTRIFSTFTPELMYFMDLSPGPSLTHSIQISILFFALE